MKQRYKTIIIFLCNLLCLTSCIDHNKIYLSRKKILEMNPALQRVLDCYCNDEEKLRAAEFLIDNLPYHKGVAYTNLEPSKLAYRLFGSGEYTQFESRDSVKRKYGYWGVENPMYQSDIYINPDFLIDNIDWAFKVWKEQPWGKDIGFEQFCEYILPYRVGNEQLYPWREKIYRQFQPIIDALPNDSNKLKPTYIVSVLLDSLLKEPFYFTGEISSEIRVGPDIVETRGGSCLDLSDMLVYICRALGIPCGIDCLPMRGDNNAPHFINFIEDTDGRCYYFSILYRMGRVFHCELIRDVYGKMYRHTFSVNKEMVKQMDTPMEEVYPSFRYPCIKDVTSVYAKKKSWDLKIPRNKLLATEEGIEDDELLYLCMSNRYSWVPVGFSKQEDDTIIFENCHGGVTYCIGKYHSDRKMMTMVTDPFWVEKDSCCFSFFAPEDEVEDVTLFNKFGMVTEFFIWRMEEGVFEGSNESFFKSVDTLYKIPIAPERLCTRVKINNPKKYKYLRYKGKDGSYCDVSEVGFYAIDDLNKPLTGKIIGPKEGKEGDHSFYNVFDKKTDTSYNHPKPDGGWAGLALDKPTQIGKIMYTPRNRDNFVRKGDTYELFICKNGKWISHGIQVSTSDSLLYHDVPKNALLLLRNHTRGVAERIFEYKDGKQYYK